MVFYRAELYRNHKVTELLVQAVSLDDARREIKREWNGWKLRQLAAVLPITRTWKIAEWTTD